MKLTIRQGVWETNSSSMHAIAIPKDRKGLDDIIPRHSTLKFNHEEFGWEQQIFETPMAKAAYLYQALFEVYPTYQRMPPEEAKKNLKERNSAINWIYETLGKYDIEAIFDTKDYDNYGLSNGYIDHGYELEEFISSILHNEKRLLLYLFGNAAICTSNDNCNADEYFNFINNHSLKDYEVFKKGN